MKKLIKAVAYCRVSTDSKEQEQSYENQKSYFLRKLSKENGYDLVEIYADKGLTGTSFRNRTEFNRMLSDAGIIKKDETANIGEIRSKYINTTYVVNPNVKPSFNYIYVKNSSRFARNIEVVSILRALKKQGVIVFFEDIGKSTENEADDMIIQFLFSMDERESKDKSMKIRMGNAETARQGKVRSINLYGYSYNKIDNTLRIIQDEAEIVKKIFALRLEGKGSRIIANMSNEEGYRARKGGEFKPHVVNRILQNPTYCGKVVRNKYEVKTMFGENSQTLKDKSDWIILDSDKVDKIIEDDVFEKVQELIQESTSHNIKKGKYQGRSELATKIICSNCGGTFTRNSDTKKRAYGEYKRYFYNCGTKKKKSASVCNMRNVTEAELYNIIEKYCEDGYLKTYAIKSLNLLKDKVKKHIENIKAIKNEENEILLIEKEKEVNNLKEQLERLMIKSITDSSDAMREIYNKLQNELDDKIKILELEIKDLKIAEEEKESIIEFSRGFIDIAEKYISKIPNTISKEEFISNYLINFVVTKDNVETITIIEKLTYKVALVLGIVNDKKSQIYNNNKEFIDLTRELVKYTGDIIPIN